MTEKRKRLDDRFKAFVKGADDSGGAENKQKTAKAPEPKTRSNGDLMSELMKPAKVRRVPVTLTMNEELNKRLTGLARKTERTRSELVEIALEKLFEQVDPDE